MIIHTMKRSKEVFVFEHVPADVCHFCGDTILSPDTVKHIENILKKKGKPEKMVPLFDYV